MHNYLTSMEKYTTELPVYIKNALPNDSVIKIRKILDNLISTYGVVDESDPRCQKIHFQPRAMRQLSRVVIEYDMPKEIEEHINSIIFPIYDGDIRLSHHSYLGYDLKYSQNLNAPSLPPHIDAAETLITFNYQLGGNIEWDIVVDGKSYDLKTGDAVIFSAVNQVHWRPKRNWKPGEYVEILTINYSPLSDWRFTGEDNPIDMFKYPEKHKEYIDAVSMHPRLVAAWDKYSLDGLAEGIDQASFGNVTL